MRTVNRAEGFGLPHVSHGSPAESNPLDTCFFAHHADAEGEQSTTPDGPFHRWLSVEQIRKMERMRRETVLAAMRSGELPFEQRGRSDTHALAMFSPGKSGGFTATRHQAVGWWLLS